MSVDGRASGINRRERRTALRRPATSVLHSRRVFAWTEIGTRSKRPVAGCSTDVGPFDVRKRDENDASHARLARRPHEIGKELRVGAGQKLFRTRRKQHAGEVTTIGVDTRDGSRQRRRIAQVGAHCRHLPRRQADQRRSVAGDTSSAAHDRWATDVEPADCRRLPAAPVMRTVDAMVMC